jgi:hypothetical protein
MTCRQEARTLRIADVESIAVTDGESVVVFVWQSRCNGRVLLLEMRARCGVDGGCFYITMSSWDPGNSVQCLGSAISTWLRVQTPSSGRMRLLSVHGP